jgi:3-oxoadipate enol-lactonase
MNLRAANHRIHFDVVGPGDGPLVCLAHALSSDSGVWSEQLSPLLARGWQVLRVDMRGHGGSDPVASHYGMRDLASDVLLVVDFLAIRRFHFVGVSIGGMIGQTLGIHHADRLHSLTLCGTSPTAVPGGAAMWEARFAAIHAAGSVAPLADNTMRRWFTDGFKSRRPDRWRQIHETIAATTPAGYCSGARAIAQFDVLSALSSISIPTFVICGDEDTGTPPAGNRTIARLIPGARYHEMLNARHIPMLEYPELFNRQLLDWLSSQRSTSAS